MKIFLWFLLFIIIVAGILLLFIPIYFIVTEAYKNSPKHKCKYCSGAVKSFCKENEKWKQECKGYNHKTVNRD